MPEQTTKKRLKNPNFDPRKGKAFSKENQPDPELKSAGWAKRKTGQSLAKAILDLKFKGKSGSQIKAEAAAYYGVPEEEITVEQIMLFRQAEKAISKSDTPAFKAVMERAHGQPKQEIEQTGSISLQVTRKIIGSTSQAEPRPDVHTGSE